MPGINVIASQHGQIGVEFRDSSYGSTHNLGRGANAAEMEIGKERDPCAFKPRSQVGYFYGQAGNAKPEETVEDVAGQRKASGWKYRQ